MKGAADAVLGTGPSSADSAYDTRSGTLLTFILLFVVGWIPILGQMVAGYVGGRRAGSPSRGFVATFVATFAAVVILFAVSALLTSMNSALANDPEAQIAAVSASSPLLGQGLSVGVDYLQGVFGGTGSFEINFTVYAMTIAFGIIGGVLADQSRKETRLIINSAGTSSDHRIRSLDKHRSGKTLGFESFEECTAMGVNSMNAVKRPAPVVKAVETRPQCVTETVDASPRVVATPTASAAPQKTNMFTEMLRRTEPKTETQEADKSSSGDELEFI